MSIKIQEIISRFNIGVLISSEKVNEGVLNDNCILNTSKGKFFLKTFKNKSLDKIKYISLVEKFMKDSGIPAVDSIFIDEESGCVLYPFVESDRSHLYDLQDYFIMGHMLGKIHQVSYGKDIPGNIKENYFKENTDRDSALVRLKDYEEKINKKEKIDDIDKLFLTYIRKKIMHTEKFNDLIIPENDTVIHGDFHPGNLLIDKETRKIIGVCDWEKTQFGPRSYDLARAYIFIGFGTDTLDIKECLEISESFLKGYKSVLEINDEEFKKGLLLRLKNNVLTTWIEDRYYKENDSKANKFIENAIMTMDHFLGPSKEVEFKCYNY